MSPAPERAGRVAGVGLWHMPLRASDAELDRMLAGLSPGEQEKAARLIRPEVRRRFVASRSGLRQVLAQEGAASREELRLGPFGKPFLPGGPRFSVSHADELALIAVDPGRELGVDLELLRAVPESEAIARLCFSADELAELGAAPAGDALAVFFGLWTRREAYLKALGTGFSGEEARIPFDGARWEAHPLPVPAGFAAALVVERQAAGQGG